VQNVGLAGLAAHLLRPQALIERLLISLGRHPAGRLWQCRRRR
jgi:hypothetical protein